jgi:hypothetical protein
VDIDQPWGNDETLGVEDRRSLRRGQIGADPSDAAGDDQKIGHLVEALRRVDDPAAADEERRALSP